VLFAIYKLPQRVAWAPIAVLIFHAIIAKTRLRTPLDFTMHFLGGASMAYVFFHTTDYLSVVLGKVTEVGRYLFAFALACTVGVFWEFAEYTSDVYRHTHIQQSLPETMSDLIADATGAATCLLLMGIVRAVILRVPVSRT
jgi:hypothetical protein